MALCFGQSMAEKETQARMQRTAEAQQLLLEGDVAYSAGKHSEASVQFLKARNLLPDAPATRELREAATERYATATVQAAATLSRKGDVEGAKKMIDQVLTADVAPAHAAALAMRDQLNDPIRTNPALTKEHAQQVDEVRRTLYEAQGFEQLGKFDMAKSMYEEVLRIDPTNKAARRGLEKMSSHESDYAKAAFDHTRAKMLEQVDALWETPVPSFSGSVMMNPTESASPTGTRFINELMNTIVFPSVNLEGVGIEEAVDFVRQQSRQLDTSTTDPRAKGLNIVLNLGSEQSEIGQKIRAIRFNLSLKNVPANQLLKYICDQTRTQYSVDDFAITIRPLGAEGAELVGRTYRVPPDFLSADAVGAAPAAPANPFDDAPAEGLLARRATALEKLRSMGVNFPEGAKATYNPGSSSIFVYNTTANHEFIQQIVDTLAQTEPVQVVIRVTMIKVLQTQLKELGFDWMFGNIGLGGNGFSGGDATFLGGGTAGSGDPITDMSLTGSNSNPVTSGNRSGDTAIRGDGIDSFIQRSTNGFSPPPQRAPGVLSLIADNIDDGQVMMMMRGLDQKKGSDVMVRPATVTRSGQTSKIEIIQELIYPTEYEPPQLPQQVGNNNIFIDPTGGLVPQQAINTPITPATPTAFDKRDVGVILEVSPVVSADRRFVELALRPEMITFDGFVNYGTPITSPAPATIGGGGLGVGGGTGRTVLTANRILQPVFSVIRSNTNVTVADGSTLVLGGLVEEKVQNVEDQVPILGSMPFVGRLFQSKARQPVRKNVIIMVHVELQDPSGRPYRDR